MLFILHRATRRLPPSYPRKRKRVDSKGLTLFLKEASPLAASFGKTCEAPRVFPKDAARGAASFRKIARRDLVRR